MYKALTPKPAFVIDADDTGAALGAMFLSTVGDIDHDGVPDIYASDFSNAAKGPPTGRIYVHSGADGRRLLTLTGETAGEGFGVGPANAGDVDGDGHDDLIIGAWQYGGAAISGGRAYLYSGKDGHLMKTSRVVFPGDTFGFDAVGIGDVDGDGTTRLPDYLGMERHPWLSYRSHVRRLERVEANAVNRPRGLFVCYWICETCPSSPH